MNELVSVAVITYQHKKWIGKALDSILNQETTFSYKIYVHDDASTDGTREVVETYAKKYPSKIIPFIEMENQYSKGKRITIDLMLPYMKGKYIAVCEGDDYWISTHKLQKQIDYLETHSDCTFSFSNAIIVDADGNTLKKFLPHNTWSDKNIRKKFCAKNGTNFSMDEMILLDFIPTASTVYYRKTLEVIQEHFDNSLDLLTRLIATSSGYAHYHNEVFSVYRTGNPNSMSYHVNHSKENMKKYFCDLHKEILNNVDCYTKYHYHDVIEQEIERNLMEYYIWFGDLKNAIHLRCYHDLTLISKIRLLLNMSPINFVNILSKIRNIFTRYISLFL